MADILCGYTVDRDEILIAYLYGEIDAAPRAAFEAHLVTCERCRNELSDLRSVRSSLQEWTAPEATSSAASGVPLPAVRPGRAAWLREMPLWARAAAALLVVGASAGMANLDVRYDRDGLRVRTGWSGSRAPAATEVANTQPAGGTGAPWRADLEALEQRLRTEGPGATAKVRDAADSPDAQLLRRVRALVQESERRQQNDIALRIAEVARDFDAKRGADLVNIDRSLRTIQSSTGIEVARQGQVLNYLATRVSLQK